MAAKWKRIYEVFTSGIYEITGVSNGFWILDDEHLKKLCKLLAKDNTNLVSEVMEMFRCSPQTIKNVQEDTVYGEPDLRISYAYATWRKSVLERDDYECVDCGDIEDLHIHHIKSYADYPDLRIDLDNGITVCGKCHRKYHGKKVGNG